jgi:hypothetical protein
LTSNGWTVVEAHRTAKADSTKVFVAMAFDQGMILVYDDAIGPAIRACGYNPIRIDREQFLGDVVDEIIAHIRESRFLVADMTRQKGGMYFEGGFAMGLGTPVIWSCHKDEVQKLHFDTRNYNHLIWETKEELRKTLEMRIRATIGIAPGAQNP